MVEYSANLGGFIGYFTGDLQAGTPLILSGTYHQLSPRSIKPEGNFIFTKLPPEPTPTSAVNKSGRLNELWNLFKDLAQLIRLIKKFLFA